MGSIPVFPEEIGDDWSPRISFSNSFSCSIDITQAIVDDYYVHHDRRYSTKSCCANRLPADQQFEFSVMSPHEIRNCAAADCRTDQFRWQDQSAAMIVDPHPLYQRILPADELFCNGKLRVSNEQSSGTDFSAAEIGDAGSESDQESMNPCRSSNTMIENGQRSGEDDESISEEWVEIEHGRRQRIDGRSILIDYSKPSVGDVVPDLSSIRQSDAVRTESVTESEKSEGNLLDQQQHGGSRIRDDHDPQAATIFRRRITAVIGSPMLISNSSGGEFDGESREMPSASDFDAESAGSSIGCSNSDIVGAAGGHDHEKSISASRPRRDVEDPSDGDKAADGDDQGSQPTDYLGDRITAAVISDSAAADSTESPFRGESTASAADGSSSGGAQAERDPPDLPVSNADKDADDDVDFAIFCRCRSISTTHSSPLPDQKVAGRRSMSGRAALISIATTIGSTKSVTVSQRSTERSASVRHLGGELPDQRAWQLTSRQMLLLAAARRSVERNSDDSDESRRRRRHRRRRDATDGSDVGGDAVDGLSSGSDVDTSVSSEGKGENGNAEFDETKEEEMAAIREMLARKLQWSRRRGGGDCRSLGHVKPPPPPPHHRKCVSLINLNYHHSERGHRRDEKNVSVLDGSGGKSAAAAEVSDGGGADSSSTSFRSLSLPSPPKSDSQRRRTGGAGIVSFLQEIMKKPKVVGAAASMFGGGGGRLAFWRLAGRGGGGGGKAEEKRMDGVHIDTTGNRSVDHFTNSSRSSPPLRTSKCPWRTKATTTIRPSSFSQPPSPTSAHHRSAAAAAGSSSSFPLSAVSVDDSLYLWKGRRQARPVTSPEAGMRIQRKSGMMDQQGGHVGAAQKVRGGGGYDGGKTKAMYWEGGGIVNHHATMTSASASVRVAPVLNVPPCISPVSLRAKSSSKVKQLSHLLFPKQQQKTDHHRSQRPKVNALAHPLQT